MSKAFPSSLNGPSLSFLDLSQPSQPFVKASLIAQHILPGTTVVLSMNIIIVLLFPPSIPIHMASQQRKADSSRSKTVSSPCIIRDTSPSLLQSKLPAHVYKVERTECQSLTNQNPDGRWWRNSLNVYFDPPQRWEVTDHFFRYWNQSKVLCHRAS